jgi:hypothetical protein
MEQRIRRAREEIRMRREKGEKFDTPSHKAFLVDSSAFMQHTNKELVEEDRARKGAVEISSIPESVDSHS